MHSETLCQKNQAERDRTRCLIVSSGLCASAYKHKHLHTGVHISHTHTHEFANKSIKHNHKIVKTGR